ncbi:unnamed protein product, partial [Polarella glacialis]
MSSRKRPEESSCASRSPVVALAGRALARLLPLLLLPLLVAVFQPQGEDGKRDLKLVLLAAACGTVISAAVPRLHLSLIAVAFTSMIMLSVAHLQDLQNSELEQAVAGQSDLQSRLQLRLDEQRQPESEGALSNFFPRASSRRSAAEIVHALRYRPAPPKTDASAVQMETFSIVLPCAFEGEFAEKTVWAIWENTDHHRLKEIIVVDDGSNPPLRAIMSEKLLAGGPGVPPMKIVRHEKTMGLITAKKSGGDSALGDVIVFFDCHISPRKGWEEAFLKQMKRKGDHRTMVVPTITSLNPDTWQEIQGSAGGKVCYIRWNNDFTWLIYPGRDAPLMSGGLLALTRRWWEETGGYDDKMVAWGGENIDQSLRSWLCGGRIEVAEGAYVAHMWRDASNPKTLLKYPIPTADVM